MIALRDALPLVRGAQGNATAFECSWLRVALQDAAGRAGYDGWWLIDDLVAGISLYLRNCYVKNVIDVPELESMVRAALRDTGYEEVASRFRAIPPTKGISLVQCFMNATVANGPTFFDKIAETITRLHDDEVRHFHFYDLHACVDHLESEARLDRAPRSEGLRERIVAFVREHVYAQGWNQQMWCSIS